MLPQLSSFSNLQSRTYELNLSKLYHRNTMINIELDDNKVKATTIEKNDKKSFRKISLLILIIESSSPVNTL